MDKYNKNRFFTALVLEIRASLYLTPSDAIFVANFDHFLKLTYSSKLNERNSFFVCDTKQHRTIFENHKHCWVATGKTKTFLFYLS